MDSESSAQASAAQKHHKHMMFGKKQRYIEVFQCSGDDMNMVLNGGYQQQQIPSKPLSAGMLPSTTTRPQQAQPLQISIPPSLTLPIPQTVISSSSTNSGANPISQSSLIAQQQQQTAHFIAQQSLMARQQAAAAAAQLQAAQQQSDQMAFLNQNYGFLQSPAAGMHAAANPYGFPMSHHQQMPQFFYLPRPMLPMSHLMGSPQVSFPGLPGSAYVSQNPGLTANQTIGASAMPQTTSASSNVKRSYESAFRNDPMSVSAAKRVFHPNPASGNIYGNYPYPQL